MRIALPRHVKKKLFVKYVRGSLLSRGGPDHVNNLTRPHICVYIYIYIYILSETPVSVPCGRQPKRYRGNTHRASYPNMAYT